MRRWQRVEQHAPIGGRPSCCAPRDLVSIHVFVTSTVDTQLCVLSVCLCAGLELTLFSLVLDIAIDRDLTVTLRGQRDGFPSCASLIESYTQKSLQAQAAGPL